MNIILVEQKDALKDEIAQARVAYKQANAARDRAIWRLCCSMARRIGATRSHWLDTGIDAAVTTIEEPPP